MKSSTIRTAIAVLSSMVKSRIAVVSCLATLAFAIPNSALAQMKYVRVANQAPQTAYVTVSGWGNATIAPGGVASGGPERDLRRSVYVTARVGFYKTGAQVPYRNNVASCRIVRTPRGTIQILQ